MEAYVKYNYFHKEQKKPFKDDIFRLENLYYNKEQDYFVCPMGQHMERVGTAHTKTESGYRTLTGVYRAKNCEGCPLRWGCYKSKEPARTIKANHQLITSASATSVRTRSLWTLPSSPPPSISRK